LNGEGGGTMITYFWNPMCAFEDFKYIEPTFLNGLLSVITPPPAYNIGRLAGYVIIAAVAIGIMYGIYRLLKR
jgi:uncharacterized membrane protein